MSNNSRILSISQWLGIGLCFVYHLTWIYILYIFGSDLNWETPSTNAELIKNFVALGGIGGVFYCLKSLYKHGSVMANWSNEWIIWHLIRPFASILCAIMAFVIVKAGLILLDTEQFSSEKQQFWGYYFVAIIAGCNVDKFFLKIEEMGKSLFGVSPSNLSSSENRVS